MFFSQNHQTEVLFKTCWMIFDVGEFYWFQISDWIPECITEDTLNGFFFNKIGCQLFWTCNEWEPHYSKPLILYVFLCMIQLNYFIRNASKPIFKFLAFWFQFGYIQSSISVESFLCHFHNV